MLTSQRCQIRHVIEKSKSEVAHNTDAVQQLELWSQELEKKSEGFYGSAGCGKYHPPPDFFYAHAKAKLKGQEGTQITQQLSWLTTKTGVEFKMPELPITTPTQAYQVYKLQTDLMGLVGAVSIQGYMLTSSTHPNAVKKAYKHVVSTHNKEMSKLNIRERRFRRACRGPVAIKDRKTCRANLKMRAESISATQKTTPFAKLYHGDYVRAVKFVAEFCGRVHRWLSPWTTAVALHVAKCGIIRTVSCDDVKTDAKPKKPEGEICSRINSWLSAQWGTSHADCDSRKLCESCRPAQKDLDNASKEKLNRLPITKAVVRLLVSEFGARKEFTLESQKQGFMNSHLAKLVDIALEKEPDGAVYLAHILPVEDVMTRLTDEQLTDIQKKAEEFLGPFAYFLDKEWAKGVSKCVDRDMLVPRRINRLNRKLCWNPITKEIYPPVSILKPRREPVNSAGWNSVADAWVNISRIIRATSVRPVGSPPLVLKVMQLVAGDQRRWAESVNKQSCGSVKVFGELVNSGTYPWRVALRKDQSSEEILKTLKELVDKHNDDIESWIGMPKKRKGNVREQADMICGVKIPAMSDSDKQALIETGIFGANVWSNTDKSGSYQLFNNHQLFNNTVEQTSAVEQTIDDEPRSDSDQSCVVDQASASVQSSAVDLGDNINKLNTGEHGLDTHREIPLWKVVLC